MLQKIAFFEEGVRGMLFRKRFSENLNNPDIELRYLFSSKIKKQAQSHNVDCSLTSGTDLSNESQEYGILRIGVFDMKTDKLVWQVMASLELLFKEIIPSRINHEVDYLFDEFPPS